MKLSGGIARTMSAVTALACAVTLAACSGDTDNPDSSGSSGDNGGGDNGTVAVAHAYGTTDVPTNPDRVLSFSQNWTDAFAELGSPVDVQVVNSTAKEGAPWSPDAAGETVDVTATSADLITTMGMEAIAQKDPDVIFAGYVPDRETYDALNAVAPTVATVGDGKIDDWRKVTTTAGDILGEKDKASELVSSVDADMDATKNSYPALQGSTFAYAAYRAQAFSVITSPQDAANVFFTDLGMVSTADQLSGTETARGVSVSAENLDTLDVDLLALWLTGDKPETLAGWADLRAVKRGSVAELDTAAATALAGPTVRSIPWILDQLDPYFAALQNGAGNE
ncbi:MULTISPECIES: ABC transporter substrate-binding protein [Corynebacterium]|uniref:ABC transporter substrate-binding protein n=1 Tax=Corynebacterium TaxID=1716 RepID=UPI0008362BF9|nr:MULTISPECIES: ABC transporter substrate-binding protein [Corynebacterium]